MKLTRILPVLVVALAAVSMIGCGTQVPSGHRAVFYSTFGGGTQMGKIYGEGFNWHLPWNKMIVYRTQIQESEEHLTLLSSDGATITMDVSILFKPEFDRLDSLQVVIGPDYYNNIVAPNIRGIARAVAGRYKPEEIYSTKREQVAKEILDELTAQVAKNWITIDNVLIRDVKIPDKISEAINFKLAADQEAQRMQFTIKKEELEAERKRIEARGIADFQKIVATGLTDSYLKWKGIETTEKLATSQNSKVIVVGNSSNSLPIILSADK